MEAWLRCQVKPGMFSDERLVVVSRRNGSPDSYLVAEGHVLEDRVRVEVYEPNGVKWATLLTDHPYHPIPVRDEDVLPIETGVAAL